MQRRAIFDEMSGTDGKCRPQYKAVERWLKSLDPDTLARKRGEADEMSFDNPFSLKSAITFGLIFATILMATRLAITYLGKAVENPKEPFVVILGGKKVSDKILLIENLIPKADTIIIGGGMAYTFLKAQGRRIGKSICENDKVDLAKGLLDKAQAKGVKIALPEDFVITESFDKPQGRKIASDIPDGWEGVDIGPKSRERFKEILKTAKTIVWNGPMGVFEIDAFAEDRKSVV